jgi:hypothetical protein
MGAGYRVPDGWDAFSDEDGRDWLGGDEGNGDAE